MKLLYASLVIILLFVSADTGDCIDNIAGFLKNGNTEELSKNFASTVQLTMMGDENVYSDVEAKTILANFFRQNPPQSVKILHRICSSPQYRFAVIMLATGNGTYRTSFYLKNIQGKFELSEMRIEPAKTK
jgi:hypothetical protein